MSGGVRLVESFCFYLLDLNAYLRALTVLVGQFAIIFHFMIFESESLNFAKCLQCFEWIKLQGLS